MDDGKLTKGAEIGTPADMWQFEDTVVQALDVNVWSEADAESKIRAKLHEFATELQTIKTNQNSP